MCPVYRWMEGEVYSTTGRREELYCELIRCPLVLLENLAPSPQRVCCPHASIAHGRFGLGAGYARVCDEIKQAPVETQWGRSARGGKFWIIFSDGRFRSFFGITGGARNLTSRPSPTFTSACSLCASGVVICGSARRYADVFSALSCNCRSHLRIPEIPSLLDV